MIEALNASLLDGLDLHGQIKVAHWNIKGPLFASLHPLFESFAVSLAEYNDEIAERAVTLGGTAPGTARQVAVGSRLLDFPAGVSRDLALVKVLAERIDKYLEGLKATRKVAEQAGDADSEDLLTGAIRDFEKHGWFLRATLES